MPRPRILAYAAAALTALLAAALLWPGPDAPVAAKPAWIEPTGPQNVVVIMTDDMREDQLAHMPHTQALLENQGTRFTNATHSNPVCCPARAQFLTGKYAHNSGIWNNTGHHGGYTAWRREGLHHDNLGPWLTSAGYETILLGKFLNGYEAGGNSSPEPGWTQWKGAVRPYNYANYALSMDGTVVEFPGLYSTHQINRIARNVIQRETNNPDPFFLFVSHTAPHSGHPQENDDPDSLGTPYVAPIDRDTSNVPHPQTPAFCESDVSDKPPWIRTIPECGPQREADFTEARQQGIESLQAVDRGVEKIVDTLAAAGELDETTIIFTSDNGHALGEHRRFGKRITAYDHNTQNPLIVRGPDFPAGHTATQRVTMTDVTATILHATRQWHRFNGDNPVSQIDGRTMIPLANDPTDAPNRPVPLEGSRFSIRGVNVPSSTGIRVNNYVYVDYNRGFEEMYDLASDPHELENVAGDPVYVGVKADLAALDDFYGTCVGAECRRRPLP